MFNFVPNRFGHQCNDPEVGCDDRIIGDFELIYVIDGVSHITIERTEYNCKKGDLVLIPPFTRHNIISDRDDPHNQYWFHFDVFPFYRQDEFIAGIIPGHGYKIHIGEIKLLITFYNLLERELNKKDNGYMVFLQTILIQIITTILRQTYNTNSKSDGLEIISKNQEIIDKSIVYIYDNISRQIYIDDLCDYLHVSQSYLFKAFSKHLKFPPAKFIQFIKIKRGEQILKTSSLSIKEISSKLGFSSPFYFTRVFKEYYKVSPEQYRKRMNY